MCIRPATGTGADGTLTSCACVETTEEKELVFSLQWHRPCAVSCESYAFTVSATNVLGTEGEKSEPVVGMLACQSDPTEVAITYAPPESEAVNPSTASTAENPSPSTAVSASVTIQFEMFVPVESPIRHTNHSKLIIYMAAGKHCNMCVCA